ncbi:hypothetical protein AC1031_020811 [Aphanomyces cochlioides]|nr:hypothetical protein AC1031_020811 [Aphanomyces cochlioides]
MPATRDWFIEKLGDIVESSVRKALKERHEKALSDLNSVQKRRILNKMALKVTVHGMEEPRDTSIPGYPWIEQYSESQEGPRAQYMTHLETHLTTLLDKFTLVDIANNESVLDTVDPRLPFLLKGTADVLLVVKSKATDRILLSGLCLVMNVKKKVERKHVNQAIGQLVCASIKAPLDCYPMSLLTDLNGVWLFTYFSDKNVLTHVEFHYPKNAIDFIKATIVDPPEGAKLPLPYLPVPFKKMRVDDFLPRPVDGYTADMMLYFKLMDEEM